MSNDKDIKSMIIIAVKLTVICLSAVILLLIVNGLTKDKIQSNKEKSENTANKKLMPGGESVRKDFQDISDSEKEFYYYYEVFDNNKDLMGYIAASKGSGYGGTMKVLVAFDPELVILNVKLLEHGETPGIGSRAASQNYMKKFVGTNTGSRPIPVNKRMLGADADSVTGATITFNGIVKAITKAAELMKNELNK